MGGRASEREEAAETKRLKCHQINGLTFALNSRKLGLLRNLRVQAGGRAID